MVNPDIKVLRTRHPAKRSFPWDEEKNLQCQQVNTTTAIHTAPSPTSEKLQRGCTKRAASLITMPQCLQKSKGFLSTPNCDQTILADCFRTFYIIILESCPIPFRQPCVFTFRWGFCTICLVPKKTFNEIDHLTWSLLHPGKNKQKKIQLFFKERGKHPILFVKEGCSPPTKDMFKSSTVDGRNPARLGMYKTLLMVG